MNCVLEQQRDKRTDFLNAAMEVQIEFDAVMHRVKQAHEAAGLRAGILLHKVMLGLEDEISNALSAVEELQIVVKKKELSRDFEFYAFVVYLLGGTPDGLFTRLQMSYRRMVASVE